MHSHLQSKQKYKIYYYPCSWQFFFEEIPENASREEVPPTLEAVERSYPLSIPSSPVLS